MVNGVVSRRLNDARTSHRPGFGIVLLGQIVSVAALFVACNPPASAPVVPTAQPTSAQTQPASQASPKVTASVQAQGPATQGEANLQALIAEATGEGALNIVVPPGEPYRQAVSAFQQVAPGVQLSIQSQHIRDAHPRIVAERGAGVYSADVIIGASGPGVFADWTSKGVLEPLGPIFKIPEVKDSSNWRGGDAAGWLDDSGQYLFAFVMNANPTAYVNRDIIPEAELPSKLPLPLLMDAKWKGKIAWDDPRALGSGTQTASIILSGQGEDFLRRLLVEQEPIFTRDPRQLAEWIVRGRYPIGISSNAANLQPFKDQGIGQNVKPIYFDVPTSASGPGFGTIAVFNRAPHPKAATAFVNWLLSKDAQVNYARIVQDNSRRIDVPPVSVDTAPKPDVEYINLQSEKNISLRDKATALVNQVRPD